MSNDVEYRLRKLELGEAAILTMVCIALTFLAIHQLVVTVMASSIFFSALWVFFLLVDIRLTIKGVRMILARSKKVTEWQEAEEQE